MSSSKSMSKLNAKSLASKRLVETKLREKEKASIFAQLLYNHQCPCEDPEQPCVAQTVNSTLPPLTPPPGVSQAYWKLKQAQFCKPPSPTKFSSARFKVQEEQKDEQLLKVAHNLRCGPQLRPLSHRMRREHVRQWGNLYRDTLTTLNYEWANFVNKSDNDIIVPNDRVIKGCAKLHRLALMSPHALSTIVRRFITGPSQKDLFWLKRTEVVDCWEKIVRGGKVSKKCCVQLQQSEKTTPPFCPPIPSDPDLRMPWHIPPLKPKDGDDKRKTFKVKRSISLGQIIQKKNDPYGQERNKQRYARTVELREAMVQDFLQRTKLKEEVLPASPVDEKRRKRLSDMSWNREDEMQLAV